MTFEEYKENQELFGKIDTPEKLKFVQDSYDRYLLRLEDAKYFEPFEIVEGHDYSSVYNQRLRDIFKYDTIQENQFFLLIKPSFDPEHLLVVTGTPSGYFLKYTVLVQNYWSVYYDNSDITTVDSSSVEVCFPESPGDKLFTLLNTTISTARKTSGKWMTLDGAEYRLSRLVEGRLVTVVNKMSASDTFAGKIISILEELVSNISDLNDAILNEVSLKVDALIHEHHSA